MALPPRYSKGASPDRTTLAKRHGGKNPPTIMSRVSSDLGRALLVSGLIRYADVGSDLSNDRREERTLWQDRIRNLADYLCISQDRSFTGLND